MVSCRDGRWLALVRLNWLSRDSSGEGSPAIGSGVYLWLPLFSLSPPFFFFALISTCNVLFVIFFFPLIPAPSLFLSISLHVYSHTRRPVLFTMEIVFLQPRPEKSPITGPLCRCAIDGFPNGCRWAHRGIGTGPWSAALF